MNRARRPPLRHPLALVFEHAVDSFSTALSPDTTRHYRGTVRNFLGYLGAHHPEVNGLDQLRRELHILGWMSRLRSQVPPLSTASYINQLFALRSILNELAWMEQRSDLAVARTFHGRRRDSRGHSPHSRISSSRRSSVTATISGAMFFC